MKLPRWYEDNHTLHVGTMPPRAYYVPAAADGTSRARSLSGDDWSFFWYDRIEDVPEAFYEETFNDPEYDRIHVPSSLQMLGYDKQQYTNVRYPIPCDPPFVPEINPCGAYIKEFDITAEDTAGRNFLYFEGVDSCFFLWINGKRVGYSQVSHSPSEFDITDYVREGKNRMAVLVLKWCDGTYLEDQDKFRLTGIFRDVLLINRPEDFLFDFTVSTPVDVKENKAQVIVKPESIEGSPKLSAQLFSANGDLLGEKELGDEGKETVFDIDNPHLWNAEDPYLYELKLIKSGTEEVISQKVGVRQISIENNVILINGKPVTFRGVNRHDSHPERGAAVTREDVRLDLELMKLHNVNAIRTSHYPNAPWFVEMCSEYGFYVMSEADIETHGMYAYKTPKYSDNISMLSQDPDWLEAYLDRQERNVKRDRNQAATVMWSLGNESGYGPNLEDGAVLCHKLDPTRPVHYEGASFDTAGYHNDLNMLDVFSRMYPPADWCKEYCEDVRFRKPLVLCEYSHCMGNGPGDIEDYWQVILSHDKFVGAFLWEWCDHSYIVGEKNGRVMFQYGGDAGEELHDGNFCVDGLVNPDRQPHSGLREAAACYRPIRAELLKGDEVALLNVLDYTDAGDAYEVSYQLQDGENVTESGVLDLPVIHPHEKVAVKIPGLSKARKDNAYLTLTYKSLKKTALVPEGYVAAKEQLPLGEEKGFDLKQDSGDVEFTENEKGFVVRAGDTEIVFDRAYLAPVSVKRGSKSIISAPINYTIWRAPTDNDRNIKSSWLDNGYDRTYVKNREFEAEKLSDGRVKIHAKGSITASYVMPIADFTADWYVDKKGSILVDIKAAQNKLLPDYPRFGIEFALPESYSECTYLGYGPDESYTDKRHASTYGKYSAAVDDMHVDYIFPQENGSHYGCSSVTLKGKDGSIDIKGSNRFSLNVSPYTTAELTRADHNYELERSGSVIVHLDLTMAGIGSNSCGPELAKRYHAASEPEGAFVIELT